MHYNSFRQKLNLDCFYDAQNMTAIVADVAVVKRPGDIGSLNNMTIDLNAPPPDILDIIFSYPRLREPGAKERECDKYACVVAECGPKSNCESVVRYETQDVQRLDTIFDLFSGPWVPETHPHKKSLTKLLQPNDGSRLKIPMLQEYLDKVGRVKRLGSATSWNVVARTFLHGAMYMYPYGPQHAMWSGGDIIVKTDAYNTTQEVCEVTDHMTKLAYETIPGPYSTEYMIRHTELIWSDVLEQICDPVNLRCGFRGHLSACEMYGSVAWVVVYLSVGKMARRYVDIYDTGLGHLFLYDGKGKIYGWVKHSEHIDWESLARVKIDDHETQKPFETNIEPEPRPENTYICEYGIGSSKVRAESKPDTNKTKDPENIKFAEYQGGKLYIQGEHGVGKEAKPELKLSNSRYANHTAVGYKFTRNGKDRSCVLIKLGFMPDTRLSSHEKDMIKHRCDKAEVIAMAHIEYEGGKISYRFDINAARSDHDPEFWYVLGKTVSVGNFDASTVTCGHGIHFFFNQLSALEYGSMLGSKKDPVNQESFTTMSNAVYVTKTSLDGVERLGYVYAPVTEAVVKIQQEWKYRRNVKKDKQKFLEHLEQQGVMKASKRIADVEEVSDPDRIIGVLGGGNEDTRDDGIPQLAAGDNFDNVRPDEELVSPTIVNVQEDDEQRVEALLLDGLRRRRGQGH